MPFMFVCVNFYHYIIIYQHFTTCFGWLPSGYDCYIAMERSTHFIANGKPRQTVYVYGFLWAIYTTW